MDEVEKESNVGVIEANFANKWLWNLTDTSTERMKNNVWTNVPRIEKWNKQESISPSCFPNDFPFVWYLMITL